jgi:hypothetical protein
MANWIKQATSKHKGLFGKKAKAAGKSTHAYAEAKQNAPGKLGKEARLALTLGGLRHRVGKGHAH